MPTLKPPDPEERTKMNEILSPAVISTLFNSLNDVEKGLLYRGATITLTLPDLFSELGIEKSVIIGSVSICLSLQQME